MIAFAIREFELSKPQDDKIPLRVHLESIWRQTGKKPDLLATAPVLPPLVSNIWVWFCEISQYREMNGLSVSRITASNMKDWCWVNDTELSIWERKIIKRLDNEWMKVYS